MMRLDLYLFIHGFCKSRQKAKTLIENGEVFVNGASIKKPSYEMDESLSYQIEVKDSCPFVSRGGLKLKAILDISKHDVSEKICIDIGASTGGFTDCLLQYGAKKVYALDSGSCQLDLKLLSDERVISKEGYNARYIEFDDIGESIDVITIDVSFISQTLILPNAVKLLNENGAYISLIKPQFEVGKAKIGKGGIVKSKKDHILAVSNVLEAAQGCGFYPQTFIKSPIEGGDGNIEYLCLFTKSVKSLSKNQIENYILHN